MLGLKGWPPQSQFLIFPSRLTGLLKLESSFWKDLAWPRSQPSPDSVSVRVDGVLSDREYVYSHVKGPSASDPEEWQSLPWSMCRKCWWMLPSLRVILQPETDDYKYPIPRSAKPVSQIQRYKMLMPSKCMVHLTSAFLYVCLCVCPLFIPSLSDAYGFNMQHKFVAVAQWRSACLARARLWLLFSAEKERGA